MSAKSSLSRQLPLRTAITTSTGLASAAVTFLACVAIARMVGAFGWLAIIIAGLLIIFPAANFSELTGMYPSAAALRVWTRKGLSNKLSLMISLMYLGTIVFVIAADAFVVGHVFEAMIPGVPGILWILLLLGGITAANLRGIRLAGRIQDINATLLIVTLIVFSVIALIEHGWPTVHPHRVVTWSKGLQAVAMSVFIFAGFEWVTPLAEEFRDSHVIPRGMFWALGVIMVSFVLFTGALSSVIPYSGTLQNSLVPQLVVGKAALGPVGFWWMAIVSLTTAMTTFNGGLATASRFMYALAREKVLPPSLMRLNGQLVPWMALVTLAGVSGLLAIGVYLTNKFSFLINAGAGIEAMIYGVSAILIVNLRKREPKRTRSFKTFGNVVGHYTVAVLFMGLGVSAFFTPIPGTVIPWTALFMVMMALGTMGYISFMMPKFARPLPKKELM